jgi:antitoxin component YwqK of YwqJK toxin-antitoxin module
LLAFNLFGQSDTIVDDIRFTYIAKNDSGQIIELGNFNRNGKNKHGYWIVYDSKGTIIEKGNYKKGKKDGFWNEKDIDNKGSWSGRYKKGKKDGSWFNGDNVFLMYKKGKFKGSRIVRWL